MVIYSFNMFCFSQQFPFINSKSCIILWVAIKFNSGNLNPMVLLSNFGTGWCYIICLENMHLLNNSEASKCEQSYFFFWGCQQIIKPKPWAHTWGNSAFVPVDKQEIHFVSSVETLKLTWESFSKMCYSTLHIYSSANHFSWEVI